MQVHITLAVNLGSEGLNKICVNEKHCDYEQFSKVRL